MTERRIRVLFITRRHPWPLTRGDHRRAVHLIESLREWADVRLITLGRGEALPIDGLTTKHVGEKGGSARVAGRDLPWIVAANLKRPDPRIPLQVRLSLDSRMEAALQRELDRWQPDVVHIQPSTMGVYLPADGPWHRHVDLIDSLARSTHTQSLRASRLRRLLMRFEAARLVAFEARLAAQADSTSLVSNEDAKMPGLERSTVIPLGVSGAAFSFKAPAERPPVVIFTGGLSYQPNVEAAAWLVHEMLPHLRTALPGVTLRIVGADPSPAVLKLGEVPNVEVRANVPDMAEEFHQAAVAALPLFSGAGQKTKVLEAFATGTPVVANAEAAESINARPGVHFLRAETGGEVAAQALRVINDAALAHTLAHAARALVIDEYSWRAQAQRLMQLYGFATA